MIPRRQRAPQGRSLDEANRILVLVWAEKHKMVQGRFGWAVISAVLAVVAVAGWAL